MPRGKKMEMEGWKAELAAGAKFTAVFSIVFAALAYAGPAVGLDRQLARFDAEASATILGALGQKAELFYGAEWPSIVMESFTAQITYLCTGLLELSVLVAAMIASLGVPWKKRGLGIVFGVAVGSGFNLLRIVATITALLYAGARTAELAHDFLFRLSIILVVAGLYWAWFSWAAKPWKRNARAGS